MKVGVIGSGAIGPDLAYGFVSALVKEPGSKVYLVDIKQEALEQGLQRIRGYVEKGLAKGKLAPKVAETMRTMLVATRELNDLAECDYVLEAASEDLSVKRMILKSLEAIVRPDCLVGFATSGLPRALIAAEAKHPERCFVNHPFFPAWRSPPVEVVLSGHAAHGAAMISTLRKLGKVPVVTADVECFAADDIFCNYISEAARIVEERLATPAQVDQIVNDAIGGGGPFTVMDATRGNLLTAKCQKLMEGAKTGTPWFHPPEILTTQGDKPWHDRKNPGDPKHTEEQRQQVLDRILAVLFARTYFVADNAICAPTELDWMTRMALGFKKGILDLAREMGAERLHELCAKYAAKHPGFYVPKSISEKKLLPFRAFVKVEREGEVAFISIFRPEVKNALSKATVKEIDSGLDELLADNAVRGIIFTSDDGAIAGADINELAALPNPEACRQICLGTHPILDKIARAKKPVVAALDGPVMGGGAEFSMACHARVVGKQLLMSQPEVNLGVIPGYGGSQRLPRLVGLEAGSDLVRTGRAIGAEEASRLGWATVPPADDPKKAAVTLLKEAIQGKVKLSAVNPEPMALPAVWPKSDIGHRSLAIDAILCDVMRRGLAKPLAEGLVLEAEGFGRCKGTADMDIGMKNFIQNGPRVPAQFIHE